MLGPLFVADGAALNDPSRLLRLGRIDLGLDRIGHGRSA